MPAESVGVSSGLSGSFPVSVGVLASVGIAPSHSQYDTSTQWVCPRRGERVLVTSCILKHSEYAAQAGIGLWGLSYE